MRPAAVLLTTALLLPSVALAHDEDPLEAALVNPRATGLLVMTVVPQTPAHAAGIVDGDILLSYDGRPLTDLPSLAAAKEAAAAKDIVVCVVLRAGGERVEVGLQPGPLGLQLVPVEKGNPPSPLPADTGAALDARAAGERDEWFALSMGGEKRGMEHVTVRVDGDLLHFTHEVAFHGGDEWGLHHAVIRAVIRCGTTAEPVSFSYENALNGWISHSTVVRNEAGRAVWHAVGGMPGDEPAVTDIALRGDQSSLPSYAVAQVARLLPHEEGACLRFRPVADWDGKPGFSAAIVCVGEEALTIDGKEHATWRYEQLQLGRAAVSKYWFDAERRLVQADYGGPVATVATKEQALAGLHEDLHPRTAE